MNYIKQLQYDNEEMQSNILACSTAINELRIFLNSDKFNGVDVKGDRKDWISTLDALRHLDIIHNALWETPDRD